MTDIIKESIKEDCSSKPLTRNVTSQGVANDKSINKAKSANKSSYFTHSR